ncbi:MAG: bifunctional (p)ppGpp synthetase/guanosine-3',5'-bis(diphosphate) 3'-pyrophosphohydrolase [Gammaproteobacteria bacterium]
MKKSALSLMVGDQPNVNLSAWIPHLSQQYPVEQQAFIQQTGSLCELTGAEVSTPNGQSCLQFGLLIAEILTELNADAETLAAGMLYGCVRYAELSLEDIQEQLGPAVAKLIGGVIKMDAMQNLQTQTGRFPSHTAINNLRKMLLAMVDDVRIVLIKLAEKLTILRHMALLSEEEQRQNAKSVQDIYAPLANRLGIGHIKWELEDLAFRYLQPETYKSLSKALKKTRLERENYVKSVKQLLQTMAQELHIDNAEVSGRAKHIYSIHKKMQRKHVPLEEIFDAIAFRILVTSVEQCYTLLGHIHGLWKPVRQEFDDYISQPKSNGYRSIHTAVIGPENNAIEIQIRTFEMHQEAELGFAAHWIYKEGGIRPGGYEAKIAWLRQLLEWQQELSHQDTPLEKAYSEVLDDHIYVFTPQGDVIELPKRATPLDFAYHIHTGLGNRTRGAKVNGQIVPLTYALKIGECVEILTAREGHPSRDWLNPHLGYLTTSRAKAKVHHWFRQLDIESNCAAGQTMAEKEIRRLGLKNVDYHSAAKHLNFTKPEELFTAIGRGDITLVTLVHALQELQTPLTQTAAPILPATLTKSHVSPTDIEVEGVGNLLTHMAHCCKPIPGDSIVGYITLTQGVSIHRQDCSNVLHLSSHKQEKLIEANWGVKTQNNYPIDLTIQAYDRQGLIRDVTQLLLNEKITILALNTHLDKKNHTAQMQLTIEVNGLIPLSRIVNRITQLSNIIEVRRV